MPPQEVTAKLPGSRVLGLLEKGASYKVRDVYRDAKVGNWQMHQT